MKIATVNGSIAVLLCRHLSEAAARLGDTVGYNSCLLRPGRAFQSHAEVAELADAPA